MRTRLTWALVPALILGAAPYARASEPCRALEAHEPLILIVRGAAPSLEKHRDAVDALMRSELKNYTLATKRATEAVLTQESGRTQRILQIEEARVLLARARDRFRDLDDKSALQLLAEATATLAFAQQEPEAIARLADAHLLAAAIYLARDRTDAAKQRLIRALDFNPELSPRRSEFAPEVLAELAAIRELKKNRPTGSLLVTRKGGAASVYVDGAHRGPTPLLLDQLEAGRHLVRVHAPGFRSHLESVDVDVSQEIRLAVELVPDTELSEIQRLVSMLSSRSDESLRVFELIRKRADGARPVAAILTLSESAGQIGTATTSLELFVHEGGASYAPNTSAEALREAVRVASACQSEGPLPIQWAPALTGPALGAVSPLRPIPEEPAIYDSPWFWAMAAMATIAVAGSVVFARTSGGPPEAIEITLIPRP